MLDRFTLTPEEKADFAGFAGELLSHPRKRLTFAQLTTAFVDGIASVDDVATYLHDEGYRQDDIAILLQIDLFKLKAAVAKTAAAKAKAAAAAAKAAAENSRNTDHTHGTVKNAGVLVVITDNSAGGSHRSSENWQIAGLCPFPAWVTGLARLLAARSRQGWIVHACRVTAFPATRRAVTVAGLPGTLPRHGGNYATRRGALCRPARHHQATGTTK